MAHLEDASPALRILGRSDDSPHGRSFAAFHKECFRPAVAAAFALTGNLILADELARVAFAHARRRWPNLVSPADADVWLRRRLLGLITLANLRAHAEDGERPRRDALGRARSEPEDFWRAVRGLPREQAWAVTLHYLEELRGDELARSIGCGAADADDHLLWGRLTVAGRLPSPEIGGVDVHGRRAAAWITDAVADVDTEHALAAAKRHTGSRTSVVIATVTLLLRSGLGR
jgi:DNA-directed RNA polymerase specialized sigma24 family protein